MIVEPRHQYQRTLINLLQGNIVYSCVVADSTLGPGSRRGHRRLSSLMREPGLPSPLPPPRDKWSCWKGSRDDHFLILLYLVNVVRLNDSSPLPL
eukprot:c34465_g1_i1 orf=410-694(+)